MPLPTLPNPITKDFQNTPSQAYNPGGPAKNSTLSPYKGIISIGSVSRSSNPSQEYITLRSNASTGTTVDITGWTLISMSTGNSVTIPKGTYLVFANSLNSEENIRLSSGEKVYLITGSSPNGMSFRVNKCSGYLTQFQTFVPSIANSCPRARNEDLSSIPNIISNDACFDYINSLPSCKIPSNIPLTWTAECTKFLNTKLNYTSCVNDHKNDSDFYKPEWRVYLKRGQSVWKDRREHIVLYDTSGNFVSEFKY
jgi:hypothetical protein